MLKGFAFAVILLLAVFFAGCVDVSTKNLTIKTIVFEQRGAKLLGGVTVDLYSDYSIEGFKTILSSVKGSVASIVTTNDSGVAVVSLPAGKYAASAWKDGYYSEPVEFVLDSDKELMLKLYPVKAETLNQLLNGEEYSVKQKFIYNTDGLYNEWGFEPAIRTDPNSESFHDTGDDDFQYFTDPSGKNLEILDMNSEAILVKLVNPGKPSVQWWITQGYNAANGLRTTIKAGEQGLEYLKIELVKQ